MRKKLAALNLAMLAAWSAVAMTDLGNGFTDHGICTPVSSNKGVTTAVGARGQDVLLSLFADYRGCNGIYMIDPATGEQEFFELPFAPSGHYGVFSSLYSRGNRYYSHHSGHLTEFDPVTKSFKVFPTHTGMGMAMTEDDEGTIWTVTYPNSGLVGYNPKTGYFKDFGSLRRENWAQYHRTIAADDAGWLYFGVGNTRAQLVGFHPASGKKVEFLSESQRPSGSSAMVFRAEDGKVYGAVAPTQNQRDVAEAFEKVRNLKPAPQWYEFYRGEMRPVDGVPQLTLRKIDTGSQSFQNYRFRDGWKIKRFDPVERAVRFIDRDGNKKEFRMEYPTEGAHVSSLAATGNGLITGGTSFPMRNFVYDPQKDTMINRNGAVQWNTLLPWKNHLFVGAYNGGFLIDWQLDKPFDGIPRFVTQAKTNPRCINQAGKELIRPHVLKITADGKVVLMGGTPEYGHTGGGLALWNRETNEFTVIPNRDLIPDHSIYALAPLPDGRIFGGTTVEAGTGGEQKARQAKFFEFDLKSRKIVREFDGIPKATTIHDLTVLPDGKILGIADKKEFFLFDPATGKVVRRWNSGRFGLAAWQQGPRMFVRNGDDVYVLFRRHIVKVNPDQGELIELAESPVEILTGGDWLDGRIYFANGSRLYSYQVPEKQ